MDTQRLILFIVIGFSVMMLWQSWEHRNAQPLPATGQSTASVQGEAPPSAGESLTSVPPAAGGDSGPAVVATSGAVLSKGERVNVRTDVLDVEIDTRGADLRRIRLPAYPVDIDHPDEPFVLLNDELPKFFIAQARLVASPGAAAVADQPIFKTEHKHYELAGDAGEMTVVLTADGGNGIAIERRYLFKRGDYAIGVQTVVTNASGAEWKGYEYRQLQRTQVPEGSGNAFIYTYDGGVIYSPEEKYEKVSFEDMLDKRLERSVQGGWIAMIQHYFVGAWVPTADQRQLFYTRTASNSRYILGMTTPSVRIANGDRATFDSTIFAGPKLQDRLEELAPGLDLTVDYGALTIIAKPIFWLMQQIHNLVGNWGWTIILLTILIKLVFYKLSETSYRSMAHMRRVGPKLQQLRERHKDDKQKLNQAMMDLYKKEKINPLGGCLPIVVQIPVFIALYWVLLESVEMRQAPWVLWIRDLSLKDPYFVLPLIMGATMFIQQKLNPAPPDPIQAKIMMALPVIFTVFFAFFPSGLVLYWAVNNALSILQQWTITKRIEAAAAH
ncbi:MAG: membrane protein insertase YidC [Chromatiales bacterium]|nr:membrane protein insertase YidC [Chromatiales bacterium]